MTIKSGLLRFGVAKTRNDGVGCDLRDSSRNDGRVDSWITLRKSAIRLAITIHIKFTQITNFHDATNRTLISHRTF